MQRSRRLITYLALGVVLVFSMALVAGCGSESVGAPGGGEEVAEGETDTTGTEAETDAPETDRAETQANDQDVLPEGGTVPEVQDVPLEEAARAAGCELRSFEVRSRAHVSDLGAEIDYSSAPPTSGKHFVTPAQDGAYIVAPDVKELVHSLEHGRVVIWFKEDLPRRASAELRAFYEDDPFQTLLTPDETGSDYAISATAWNRDPVPLGTGRLLGCERFTPAVFTALEAFQEEHRGRGPEPVP